MVISKAKFFAFLVCAFANCLNLVAMEKSLNQQLWEAMYIDDQEQIERLLAKGANVNSENRDGSTLLSRYLFSEFGDKKKRANIIITLLAAGADILQPSIRGKLGDTPEWVYGDVKQVHAIMNNLYLDDREIENIRSIIHEKNVDTLTLEDFFKIPQVQVLTKKKLSDLRAALPESDWESYDKNKLQHAVELQILNSVPEIKSKFPSSFKTVELKLPTTVSSVQPIEKTPTKLEIDITRVTEQKNELQNSLHELFKALTNLEEQLSKPKVETMLIQPKLTTSAEKISNEKLWTEIYRRNPSFGKLREVLHVRSHHPWGYIRKAQATTQVDVENALIQYLLDMRGWNNSNTVFSDETLDMFNEYVKNPSQTRLNRMAEGGTWEGSE